MLKPKSPITTLEADLAVLTKRGAGLEKRRDEAAAVLLTATAERRRLLVEHDNPLAAELAKAERAVRDATDTHDAAIDAIAQVDGRASDLWSRIERLRAAEERERQADVIEASAKAADAAIERIRRSVAEIDKARADLATAILPDAVGYYTPPSQPPADYMPSYLTATLYYDHEGKPMLDRIAPEQVAARIVGHIVSTVLPDLGVARAVDAAQPHANGRPTAVLAPIAGAEAARALLTNSMREAAAAARRTLDA